MLLPFQAPCCRRRRRRRREEVVVVEEVGRREGLQVFERLGDGGFDAAYRWRRRRGRCEEKALKEFLSLPLDMR